jgi:ribosomal protein S6
VTTEFGNHSDDLSQLKEMMEHMESTPAPTGHNQLSQLVAEIKILSQQTAANIIEIGKRLIEAKSQVSHGSWERWLGDNLELSTRRAQQFMKVAEEYGKTNTYSFLTPSKAIALLDVPAADREDFIKSSHDVGGQQKTVDEMTARELAEAIRAKKEADKVIQDQAKKLQKQQEELENALIRERNTNSFLTVKDLTISKLQDENKKLELMTEDLAMQSEPTVVEKIVEKPVIPESMTKALEEARSKVAILEAELQSKQSTGDRRDDLAMRVDFFTSRINNFVRDMSSLGYMGQEYARISPQAQRKYESSIAALEKLCRDLRDAAIIPSKENTITQELREVG